MSAFFLLLISVLIFQRLAELQVAKRNTRTIIELGGYEVGGNHYKFIVLIHIGFFITLLAEVLLSEKRLPPYWPVPFCFFVLAQAFRYWCITSLGAFWNTRIFVVPDTARITKGPYRYIKHPNYLAVLIEFISFPLIFGAYRTALVWTVINYAFLRIIRIPAENKALQVFTPKDSP